MLSSFLKKPTLKTYKDRIEFFQYIFSVYLNKHNEIYNSHDIEQLLKLNETVYGTPYINDTWKKYLKQSEKSRVKEYTTEMNDYQKLSLFNKKGLEILRHTYSSGLLFTKNKELATEIDSITSLIQDIKNVDKLKEIPALESMIENRILDFEKKYVKLNKINIYTEDYTKEEALQLIENLKDLDYELDSYENEFYINFTFEGTFQELLDKLNSIGVIMNFNIDEGIFNYKIFGKKRHLEITSYYQLNK